MLPGERVERLAPAAYGTLGWRGLRRDNMPGQGQQSAAQVVSERATGHRRESKLGLHQLRLRRDLRQQNRELQGVERHERQVRHPRQVLQSSQSEQPGEFAKFFL